MAETFLLLQQRPEDAASDNEYEAFLKFSGLAATQLRRERVENGVFPEIDLARYSGILLGGGPYNVTSHPDEKKTNEQLKFEAELAKLIERVISWDFPFLAACGIGVIVQSQGGRVSRKYPEPVGATTIRITEEGKHEPLLKDLPEVFEAFAGHKEACESLPPNAILLATSDVCPVQMFRFKKNVYATQFHSELDSDGLALRIQIYKHKGYFKPEEAEALTEEVRRHNVTEPIKILRNFVKIHQRN